MTPKQLEELGLTRDSVWVEYHRHGKQYELLATANTSSGCWPVNPTVVFKDIRGNVFTMVVDQFLKKFERVW